MMQAIKRKKYLIISGLILIISLLTIYYILNKTDDIDSYDAERIIELREVDVESNAELMLNEDSAASEYTIIMPIAETRERITKKSFGTKVSPDDSPVQPERFSGYHTATDFEILDGEAEEAVAVYAVCSGQLKYRQIVNGYGGVIILACDLAGEAITLIYGHIDIDQTDYQVGDLISKGDKLAVLAPAYSYLSGDERKHLHLGIHRGEAIELRGYVSNESELTNWYDPMTLLTAGVF